MLRLFSLFATLLCLASCTTSETPQARDAYVRAMTILQSSSAPPKEAAELLSEAVQGGSTDAALALGFLTIKGNGVPADPVRAAELFQIAARGGNKDGQYNAGLAFARGEGVAKNYEKAAYWFTKAAMQGDAGAAYNMGIMAMNGEGMARDLPTAAAWFTIAMQEGYAGASASRSAVMGMMTSEEALRVDGILARLAADIHGPTAAASSSAPRTSP